MSPTINRVFSGYRRLFRARKSLFAGDHRAMAESRIAIKEQFQNNQHVKDPTQIEGLLSMVDEAEDMLLHGIVRGNLNQETGNYEVKIKADHAETMTTENNVSMEPITTETGSSLGSKPNVVTTKSGKKE
mmetsp:Transcript_8037/g.11489  ORF Transcript_8037/g.11489 Transcript_8037/m.11489 type:complete len:130 (+) Transcript_8037:168-557(+)